MLNKTYRAHSHSHKLKNQALTHQGVLYDPPNRFCSTYVCIWLVTIHFWYVLNYTHTNPHITNRTRP